MKIRNPNVRNIQLFSDQNFLYPIHSIYANLRIKIIHFCCFVYTDNEPRECASTANFQKDVNIKYTSDNKHHPTINLVWLIQIEIQNLKVSIGLGSNICILMYEYISIANRICNRTLHIEWRIVYTSKCIHCLRDTYKRGHTMMRQTVSQIMPSALVVGYKSSVL